MTGPVAENGLHNVQRGRKIYRNRKTAGTPHCGTCSFIIYILYFVHILNFISYN